MEDFLNIILSEYGVFVTFLLVSIGVLSLAVKNLWEHNKALGERILKITENNTRVLTQIVDKLENSKDEH